MKSLLKSGLALMATTLILSSCEKTEMEDPNATNTVTIEFDNRFGAQELKLGGTEIVNKSGEPYTVTTLNYFVSDLKLMNEMGEMVSFPDQYFLIKESDAATHKIELKDVPSGTYHHLSFTLGVDSLKSVSDVTERTGVLDVASYGDDNMYWSWNMGYIFFKMEGNSPVVNVMGGDEYQFHIGGFGGKDAVTPNNLKKVELHIDDMAKVSQSLSPQIHVLFDISKVMDGVNTIKLTETPMIHNPMVGTKISANYSGAFSVDHVHGETSH